MQTRWIDSADGTRLRLGQWGDGARSALIVPGLAEHAERYAHVGSAFAARGWRVSCVELRGHGQSGGRRGHVDIWSDYVADVKAAVDAVGGTPAIFAHSMGGLVTLEALRAGAVSTPRLALSNPLLGVALQPPRWKTGAAGLLSRIWPTLSLANEIPAEQISRDPEVVAAYKADPLVYANVTPRWYVEMLAAQVRVHAAAVAPPFRMFVGTADQICCPVTNRRFAESRSAAVTAYDGMRHEIVNELGKEQVIADVAAWLEAA